MSAVMSFAASNGLRRLLARTHLGNRRSDSLLEKLGFQEEGMLRGFVERDGERRDCRLFGVLL
jgi:[ribosomal protein S5]-alanine N-acetyltransferase